MHSGLLITNIKGTPSAPFTDKQDKQRRREERRGEERRAEQRRGEVNFLAGLGTRTVTVTFVSSF